MYFKKNSDLKLSKRYFLKGFTKNEKYKANASMRKPFCDFAEKSFVKEKKINCPCGVKNHYQISGIDRYGEEFPLHICRNCGLIFAPYYWNNEQLKEYYEDYYHINNCFASDNSINNEHVKNFYNKQLKKSKKIYSVIKKYLKKKQLQILDVGGACGGILNEFKKNNHICSICDPTSNTLKFAESKGYTTYSGTLFDADFGSKKFDVIILSDVFEHIPDTRKNLSKIKSIMNQNALLYIELPGIDSLKKGRRRYDFLEEIHDAHLYYFSSKSLKYHLALNGFQTLYIDCNIKAIFQKNSQAIPDNGKDIYKYNIKSLRQSEFIRIYLGPVIFPIKLILRFLLKKPIIFLKKFL